MTFMRSGPVVLGLVILGFSATAIAVDNGFKFDDPNTQATFIAALRKDGIPFQTQTNGTVTYDSRLEERVSRLRFAVLHQSFEPCTHFPDRALENQFTSRLRLEGIPFGIEMQGTKRLITWSRDDDERARKIGWEVLRASEQH